MSDGGPSIEREAQERPSPPVGAGPLFHWAVMLGLNLALVAYIAIIGIFSIVQIQQRRDALASIESRRAGVIEELATLDPADQVRRLALSATLDALSSLEARARGLIAIGAMTENGTLPRIACDLVKLDAPAMSCADARNPAVMGVFMGQLIELSATGPLLAFLVLGAAIAGGALRLTFDVEHEIRRRLFLLRSLGGGLVCYLLLSSGASPSVILLETAINANPASWSLAGLLAGMFANRVFELASKVVEAFISKLESTAS